MKLARNADPARAVRNKALLIGRISPFLPCALLLMVASGAEHMSAQSRDPAELRRIIDQKNAEAAAATWGDWKPLPPISPPSTPTTSPQPSSSSGPGNGTSSAEGSTGAGSFFTDAALAIGPPDTRSSNSQGSDPIPSNDVPAVEASTTSDSPQPTARPVDTYSDSVSNSSISEAQPSAPAKRATVIYKDGLLSVQADDSSLNQILSRIAEVTRMKIQGAVADQRVFGTYGPSKPAAILSTLLEGTGSNMVLVERPHATETELTLTSRALQATAVAGNKGGPVNPVLNSGDSH